MKIWRFSFVIINVLRCSVDYVWTFNDLVWRKICGISCFSEINLWVSMFEDFFSEENVTHELIHFGEWKMCVNMFEYFLLPIIVLCEVMHFRERKIYYQQMWCLYSSIWTSESVSEQIWGVHFEKENFNDTFLRKKLWRRKKDMENNEHIWTFSFVINVLKECANMFNDCNWFHLLN